MANEDFDIYGDLDDAFIEPLQSEIEKKAAIESAKNEEEKSFKEQSEKLIEELKTSNFQLKKNISLLLATAKSEIERKDQQIKDLRRELDELIFRKNKGANKKKLDKWSQTDKVEFSDSKSYHRQNEFNKLHENHKSKEPASFSRRDVSTSSDRHKRRTSPARKYEEPRRSSRRDETNGYKNKTSERDLSRKSSQERGRSLEKHIKNDKKGSSKESLRDDDLRKVLSKKSTDKSHSTTKEKNRLDSDRKDKSSSRDIAKLEKLDSKSTKIDSKKSSKEKSVTPKKAKSKKKSIEDVGNVVQDSTETLIITEAVDPKSIKILKRIESSEIESTGLNELIDVALKTNNDKQMPCVVTSVEASKNIDITIDQKETLATKVEKISMIESSCSALQKSIECEPNDQKVTEECKIINEEIPLNITNGCQVEEHIIQENVRKSQIIEFKNEIFVPIAEDEIIQKTETIKSIDESQPNNTTEEKSVELKQQLENEVISIPKENSVNLSTESANDSFESTKENSLNNSTECKKRKKRKIVTTEIESDGTVVWTITRKKRKT